jgi:hypothetical protein
VRVATNIGGPLVEKTLLEKNSVGLGDPWSNGHHIFGIILGFVCIFFVVS